MLVAPGVVAHVPGTGVAASGDVVGHGGSDEPLVAPGVAVAHAPGTGVAVSGDVVGHGGSDELLVARGVAVTHVPGGGVGASGDVIGHGGSGVGTTVVGGLVTGFADVPAVGGFVEGGKLARDDGVLELRADGDDATADGDVGNTVDVDDALGDATTGEDRGSDSGLKGAPLLEHPAAKVVHANSTGNIWLRIWLHEFDTGTLPAMNVDFG